MYKVDEDGTPYSDGEVIELTEEDLKTISKIFEEAGRLPTHTKNEGTWSEIEDGILYGG